MQAIGEWRHLCVDMQRMFAEETPWHIAWMDRVTTPIEALARRHAERTIFTRFMPPRHAADMQGKWRDYYQKWWMMTGEHLPDEMTHLVPRLAALVPPAEQFEKNTYSPWINGRLHHHLGAGHVKTLVLTGGETDICVLATTLGAIDLGYRVIILKDAVCSGADETHDASLELLGDRFPVQLELMKTQDFLSKANE